MCLSPSDILPDQRGYSETAISILVVNRFPLLPRFASLYLEATAVVISSAAWAPSDLFIRSPIFRVGTRGRTHLGRRLCNIDNPIVQINFDRDLIVFGDTLPIQEIRIGYRQCPGFPFSRLKRDGPLALIDVDDPAAAKDGRRISRCDSRTH
jgi:hypothetical protein